MPLNPTRTRVRVSLGVPNFERDVRVDGTTQRRKSEGEVHKLTIDIDLELHGHSASNPTPPSTPPRRREPLHRDNAPRDEPCDSDASTHSDFDARVHRRPSTPTRPRASRPSQPALLAKDRPPSPPSSHLPSPPATPSPTLCSGITKQGNPCRRTKKDAPEGWLCHSHNNSVESLPRLDLDAGFVMRFDDFIPSHLHPVTQERMQDALKKPPTKSDKPGYVYAFAYKDDVDAWGSGELNPFVIKIGRTGSEERLQQRRHDFVGCSHPHQVEEVGWWPGNVVDGNAAGSFGDAIFRCRLGKVGKYSNKVERLVHLELLDVAYNSLHLIPGYAQGSITTFDEVRNDEGLDGEWPSRKPKLPKERCQNCPRVHREIFKLDRVAGHDMVGREWEDVVRPIIEKWGRFMDEYGDMLHLITWV